MFVPLFYVYDVDISTTLISPSEKNEVINKHLTKLHYEVNSCFSQFANLSLNVPIHNEGTTYNNNYTSHSNNIDTVASKSTQALFFLK